MENNNTESLKKYLFEPYRPPIHADKYEYYFGYCCKYPEMIYKKYNSNKTDNKKIKENVINIGANIIYPTENSNIVMAFEGGIQDFTKDYKMSEKSSFIKYITKYRSLIKENNSELNKLIKHFLRIVKRKNTYFYINNKSIIDKII